MPDSTLSRTSEHFQTNPFRILRGLRCACIETTSGIALLALPRLQRAGHTGAPADDPAILLKVVLFAYSRGMTSSRTMARACVKNVVFIALACDQQPHFTTLANFEATLGQEVEAVFRDVLMVCNAQGLIGKTLFAIDGCKLPSNASKE